MHLTWKKARLATAALVTVLAAGVLAAPAWAPRSCASCGPAVLGTIIDASTKEHLAGVVIEASPAIGNPDTAESNPGGRYLLRGLGEGSYEITARAAGYRPSGPVTVEIGDTPVHLDFALVP